MTYSTAIKFIKITSLHAKFTGYDKTILPSPAAPNHKHHVGWPFLAPNPVTQNPESSSKQIRVRWASKNPEAEKIYTSLGKLYLAPDVIALRMRNVISSFSLQLRERWALCFFLMRAEVQTITQWESLELQDRISNITSLVIIAQELAAHKVSRKFSLFDPLPWK